MLNDAHNKLQEAIIQLKVEDIYKRDDLITNLNKINFLTFDKMILFVLIFIVKFKRRMILWLN